MLEISPLIMVVTFVIFMSMLYLLNKKLYGPLLKFMDDRDAAISKSMREAQGMSGESGDLESQAQQIIDDAKAKAAQVRQSAHDELQEEQNKAIAVKQAELTEKYEKFKLLLEKEKEALAEKLLSDIPMFKDGLKAKFGQL